MYIIYIATFLISLGFTLGVLPWVIRLCYQHHLYDITNSRKLHHNNIPRLGGIVFFPALLFSGGIGGVLLIMMSQDIESISLYSTILLIGAVLIYIVGVADDLFELGARNKFIIQAISALAIPFCGLSVNNLYGLLGLYELPLLVSYPLTIFVVLLIVNAMNLIDGIDGLSSSLTIVSLCFFALLYQLQDVSSYVVICFALLGTIAVFIYYNVWGDPIKHTKTFMGDAGSLIIGYALAFFVIKFAMDSPKNIPSSELFLISRANSLIISFSPIVIPIFDLIRVAFLRLFQRKGLFTPDKQHIHHLCMAKGFSMHQTLLLLLFSQMFIIAITVLMCYLGINVNVIFAINLLLYVSLLLIKKT
ncbi:MAG: undecaprenyl/decaprenyl-phosphate alpha-N-acetylglucosaminyl 1-phosphate transferase [Bacteroidales bacterium]|nr:undecaprenyl/decaprenyl-phosphate alpha-N-acetylglucosaminyl 1-phosphate transferase [Bacteroidales bacterium]